MSDQAPGRRGRPTAYPELLTLEPGGVVVLPWRVDARGVKLEGRAQLILSRAAQRAAVRAGWAIVCQGTPPGLRVTRTA